MQQYKDFEKEIEPLQKQCYAICDICILEIPCEICDEIKSIQDELRWLIHGTPIPNNMSIEVKEVKQSKQQKQNINNTNQLTLWEF